MLVEKIKRDKHRVAIARVNATRPEQTGFLVKVRRAPYPMRSG